MAELQLPPSVRDLRGVAIEAIANRMAQIDLSPILIYRIASVPAAALPFLAWQFDVADEMFALLSPGADQRQLIQNTVPLKAKVGTPYALKKALTSLGWPNATILEGQDSWGGTSWPASQGWAVCRIVIPMQDRGVEDFLPWDPTLNYSAGAAVTFRGNYFLATAPAAAGTIPQFNDLDSVPHIDALSDLDTLVQAPWQLVNPDDLLQPVTAAQIAQIVAAFYYFAPARCWLDSVVFLAPPITDALAMTDTTSAGPVDSMLPMGDMVSLTLPTFVDPILNAVLYDAEFDYSGVTYADVLVGITDGPVTMNGVPVEDMV